MKDFDKFFDEVDNKILEQKRQLGLLNVQYVSEKTCRTVEEIKVPYERQSTS